MKTDSRSEGVTELINFYSIILLFGTFLFGIAQSMLEPRQVEIDGVSVIWSSYNPAIFYALAWSSVALIAGCLVGIFGLVLHVLLYYNGYRDYIINGFFIDAMLAILLGMLYFIFTIVESAWHG